MNGTDELKLSDIENTLKDLNMPVVESLSNGLYKLPEGIVTNEKGLELFNKIVLKEVNTWRE